VVADCCEALVLVKSFVLRPLDGFGLHDFFDGLDSVELGLQWLAVVELHGLLARWTVHEAECDPRRRPFVFDDSLDAVDMEDVSTPESDARLSSKARYPADRAVSVFVDALLEKVLPGDDVALLRLFSSLRGTVCIQAGQALLLPVEPSALMAALVLLLATCVLQVLALLLQTGVLSFFSVFDFLLPLVD